MTEGEQMVAAADREILAAVFASRIALVKKTREQAMAEAGEEWERAREWLASGSKKERSFLWYCVEFDIDPDAVRKAVLGA